MATDIQDVTMTGDYVPYERPPQPYTLWTAIPRGLQSFIVDGQVLDAKADADTAILNLNATLPPNFAYVLADINYSLTQNRAFDWDEFMSVTFQNFYRANITLSIGLAGTYVETLADSAPFGGRVSMIVDNPMPTFPMIVPEGVTGPLFVMSASNQASNATLAGTINAFVSFWQFDLEQVRKFAINSPIPTHSR